MSTSPLVVHHQDAQRIKHCAPPIAEVSVSDQPFGRGSTKYVSEKGKVPGYAVSVVSEQALDQLISVFLSDRQPPLLAPQKVLSVVGHASEDEPEVASTWLGRAAQEEIDSDPSTRDEPATMRKALVNARLGQGGYRRRMFEIWGGRCAVSGCAEPAALIASHAKPWSECADAERLDAFNGLLLAASIDRLFDQGLVAFSDDGRMLRRAELSIENLAALGVRSDARLRRVLDEHLPYLAAHRKHFRFD